MVNGHRSLTAHNHRMLPSSARWIYMIHHLIGINEFT